MINRSKKYVMTGGLGIMKIGGLSAVRLRMKLWKRKRKGRWSEQWGEEACRWEEEQRWRRGDRQMFSHHPLPLVPEDG